MTILREDAEDLERLGDKEVNKVVEEFEARLKILKENHTKELEVVKTTLRDDHKKELEVVRNEVKKVWYQVGIVSYGPERCGTGVPGVYTNVASYISWIRRNLSP